MAEIKLTNVRKSFRKVDLIKGVALQVNHGEFVVFVDPLGCGASTLLRTICGLESISSRQLIIRGEDMSSVEATDRSTAMVVQSYALYPHMTVAQNMCFGLRMAKTPKAEVDTRVRKAAMILQITYLPDRKPKEMSGSQRQCVAIVREPKAFLFDEPLSNLDAELRVQMRVKLSTLHHDLGARMIYATHDQVKAMTMADKIVVLRDGLVEQFGTPLELYARPNNSFVAGFIGSPRMNFLNAEVLESGSSLAHGAIMGIADRLIVIPLRKGMRLRKRQRVSVGIRPEHLVGTIDGAGLEVGIDDVENLGGMAYAYGTSTTSQEVILKSEGEAHPKYGTILSDDYCHLFDAEGNTLSETPGVIRSRDAAA